MRHYTTPPSFDPTLMIDVDELRKELMVDQDETMNDGMMLEDEENDEIETDNAMIVE
jgi:hypothetical protein